jgi:hypothetical protein
MQHKFSIFLVLVIAFLIYLLKPPSANVIFNIKRPNDDYLWNKYPENAIYTLSTGGKFPQPAHVFKGDSRIILGTVSEADINRMLKDNQMD